MAFIFTLDAAGQKNDSTGEGPLTLQGTNEGFRAELLSADC
jgi:hypothetical protein